MRVNARALGARKEGTRYSQANAEKFSRHRDQRDVVCRACPPLSLSLPRAATIKTGRMSRAGSEGRSWEFLSRPEQRKRGHELRSGTAFPFFFTCDAE